MRDPALCTALLALESQLQLCLASMERDLHRLQVATRDLVLVNQALTGSSVDREFSRSSAPPV
jgi:hypothetical protein